MKKQFKKIVDENNGILYKIGRSYTIEEVDFKDLYQEILIQMWKSIDNFKGDSKISTWIYRVALNTALTYQKKSKRNPFIESLENVGFKTSIVFEEKEEAHQREEKIELLYKCINLLKKEDRAIILLNLEGKKYEEIAEIIGLTTSHVGVKIRRIKERLQKLLKENNYGRI